MTTGPVDLSPRTARDHMRPVLYHYDPEFLDLFARTLAMLQALFRTSHDTLILQGETMLGLEAAVASLVSPGDTVVNLVSGIYGKGFESFLTAHGADVVELAVPYDQVVDPDMVRHALRSRPGTRFLSLTHVETPSGTVQPLRDICAVAREFGVLTIVDVAASLGSEPLAVDDWGVDVAVGGPQKALGAVPGLALLAVSPRAWAAMERKRVPLRGSYLSLLDWKEAWAMRRFPHAPTVTAVYALESALTQVLEMGIDRWTGRHAAIAAACRAGVRALGFAIWPARDEIAAAGVTTVRLPEGLSDRAIVTILRDRYGVLLTPSDGVLADRVLRLGHFARAAHPTYLAALLGTLERALADRGRPVRFGAGVGAAMAALEGWNDAAP